MPIDSTLIGREYYVFRDSTHNLISIEEPNLGKLLRSILDTTEFQRLRQVRQNGLGFLVYPSLETSRFAHSLGSFAVAKRVVEALRDQQPSNGEFGFPESLRIDEVSAHGFAVAAALHDIGHGPLSHAWDELTAPLLLLDPSYDRADHERVGSQIVDSKESEIGSLFSRFLSEPQSYEGKVISAALGLLHNDHHLTFLRPLLSGNLDIDRLDFIARDTRAAGVTYGQHDLDWLIRSLRFGRLPEQYDDRPEIPWVIAIDARKGLNALVQYLRARENMYGLVYLHKTVRAANAHLGSIVLYAAHLLRQKSLAPDNNPILSYLQSGRWSHLSMASADDADLWSALRNLSDSKDSFLRSLARDFRSRRLFKSREVGQQTAESIRTLLFDGTLTRRLRARMSNFPQLHDLNDHIFSRLLIHVDEVPFDIIGKEKERRDQTWIMYRRSIDLGLIPLRDYWRKTIGAETSRDFRFVHFHEAVQNDVLEFVTRLEGTFPRIAIRTDDSPNATPTELPTAPARLRIERILSDDGKFKVAYVALCTETDASGFYSAGEAYVLKRYRDISAQNSHVLKDTITNIFQLRSEFLAQTVVASTPKDDSLWLVEKLWISDLLRLVQDTGIRRDIIFLMSMAHDLFRGLAEIAGKNIRHGDIKLENCGVIDRGNQRLRFQIGDFGSAAANATAVPLGDSGLGSLKTRPPELLRSPEKRRVGLASDVWSMAATVFAAAVGRYPFMLLTYDRNQRLELAKQIGEQLESKLETLAQMIDNSIPPILGKILRPCLIDDIDKRPTAEAVVQAIQNALPASDRETYAADAMLWQRLLDLEQLASFASRSESLANSIRAEYEKVAQRDPKWVPRGMLKVAMDRI